MLFRNFALISICLILVAACATPYQESGWAGGVKAAALGGDNYRIEAHLNGYSRNGRLQDFLLLRAAEVAQENGAVGFVIAGGNDDTRTATVVVPGSSTTTATAFGSGNYVYGQAYTTHSASTAYNIVKPGGLMLITLVREPVPIEMRYMKAAEIIAAIGPRVRR